MAEVTFGEVTGSDLVRFACDLLVAGIDAAPAVELAGAPFNVEMRDAEPMFRELVSALGRPDLPRDEAGWVLARRTAEQMVANSIPVAAGARRLWGLWWECGKPTEIAAFVELLDTWDERLQGQRDDIEEDMRVLAPAVLEAADRALPHSKPEDTT